MSCLLFLSSLEVSYKLIEDVVNLSQIPDFVFRNGMEKRRSLDLEAASDASDASDEESDKESDEESLESGCITLLNF